MVAFVQTPAGVKGEGHLDTWVKKNILCRGQQCKSPKAGLYLVCGESSEETNVAGAERTRGQSRGDGRGKEEQIPEDFTDHSLYNSWASVLGNMRSMFGVGVGGGFD